MRKQMVSMSMFAMSLSASAAIAQDDPDYGFEFVTIGDPGNRNTVNEELDPFTQDRFIGAVDYEFRIAKLEVTVGQYFEFAEVYHPYYTINTGNVLGHFDFTGGDIRLAWGEIMIRDEVSPNKPINMGWEYAARYINWLHNGKVNEEWAFETGVYDTSTFTQNDDGSWNHQVGHSSDARYRFPTRDEWTKAAYWDIVKNAGKGGYWRFPNSSDTQSLPETERNGSFFNPDFPLDVGSFPQTMSPWGVLDFEGGVAEWTETVSGGNPGRRFTLGSSGEDGGFGDMFHDDILARFAAWTVFRSFAGGIRLVSPLYSSIDLNQDWHVNYYDISLFIQRFASGDLSIDYNADGDLDIDDVLIFLELAGP